MKGGKSAMAILLILIVAAAAIIIFDPDLGSDDGLDQHQQETFTITYELNGGVQNPLNPGFYTTGTETGLYDPWYPDGEMLFTSWFLDSELSQPVESIGSDSHGDVTLYAGWSNSLAGKGLEFTVSGTYSSGLLMTYDLSGSISYEYLYYDQDRGYLRNIDRSLIYESDFGSFCDVSSDTDWTGDGSTDTTWTDLGTEIIDTVNGPKECQVLQATLNGGTVETQWIGDGWIPYIAVVESADLFSQSYIVLTVSDVYNVDVRDSVALRIYADDGISVRGSGDYSPGETVTVSVSTEPGTSFAGWYDSQGELISRSTSLSLEIGAQDRDVYAMNTADPDFTLYDGDTLSADKYPDNAVWTVYGLDDDSTVSFEGDISSFRFEAGSFLVMFESQESFDFGLFTVDVDGYVTVECEWEYGDRTYSYDLDILFGDVCRYRDLYDVSQRQQDISGNHARDVTFVTYEDRYVLELASALSQMTSGWSDLERVNFVLSFCQNIGYEDDQIYMGYEEYWKFPLETLYDHGGDCEDTSILMAALCKAMGYDTSLILLPGHMASGVNFQTSEPGLKWFYLLSDPTQKRYYYCETTAIGFTIGELPTNINTSTIYMVVV